MHEAIDASSTDIKASCRHAERSDDEIMRVGWAITRMFRVGKRAMRTTIVDGNEELTPANVGILINLDVLEPCRVAQLADHLYVDSSTVSRQVDHLVNRDLVERSTDPQDRRAMQLSLTKAGRTLLERVSQQRCDLWRRTFEIFSDDELATLTDLHQRLTQQLDTVVGSDIATPEG